MGLKEDEGAGLRGVSSKAMGRAGSGRFAHNGMSTFGRCFSFQTCHAWRVIAACASLTNKMHNFHT